MEYLEVDHEEYETFKGVFSSIDKAKEAIEKYKEVTKDYLYKCTYSYIECEVDKLWEQ